MQNDKTRALTAAKAAEGVRIQCPLVYLGCNWRGVFDTLPEAVAAERAHWVAFHDVKEDEDGAAQSAE